MPKINVNGVNIHYITVGSGPDIVMLHGFLGNLAVWHLQIVPELRKHFRVTTPDLRGHGYSDVTPDGYTCKDLSEDLLGVLDTLKIERPIIVGHSYGADISMYFALMHPDRVSNLIALEPGLAALVHHRKDQSWPGWDLWASKLAEVNLVVPPDKRNDLEFLLQLSLETPKFYGPARGLPRNREPLIKLIRNTTLIRDYEFVGDLTLEAVHRIGTRTLLMYGEHSHFLSSYDYLRKELPNCKPVLLAGGEHFGPLEQPELLTQHMLEFLAPDTIAPESGKPDISIGARAG